MGFCRSGHFAIGVELELIGRPRIGRTRPECYYADLANSLNNTLTHSYAAADRLDQPYRKYPEHYDKWWITKDGSLNNPAGRGRTPKVCRRCSVIGF